MVLDLDRKERRLVHYAVTFLRENIDAGMVADLADDGFDDETLDTALYKIIERIWEAPPC